MVWSRADQLRAYQFLRRRSVSALLLGDANHPESPNGRPLFAVVAGAVVLVLVLAGFGVYGLLRPGASDRWRNGDTIVVEKETGTRYVLADDGRLHPVLNYASARLATGAERVRITSVAAASLRGAPRGPVIGIPGAPDSLPAPKALVTDGWTVCSRVGPDGAAVTSVLLTAALDGADPGTSALLVRDRRGTTYLASGGYRWAVRDAAVLPALNYTGAAGALVSDGWLDTVPAGTDLRFPPVAQRGAAPDWPAPAGVRVGQVVQVSTIGAADRYFLVESRGVRPVGAFEAALLLGDPAAGRGYPRAAVRPVPVGAAALSRAPVLTPTVAARYPDAPPPLVDPGGAALCAVSPPDGDAAAALRLVDPASLAARSPLTSRAADGVHEVAVPPGAGALVRAGATGPLNLITDQGVRFPLPDPGVAETLGYAGVTPVVRPPAQVALIPAGPLLSRAAALRGDADRP